MKPPAPTALVLALLALLAGCVSPGGVVPESEGAWAPAMVDLSGVTGFKEAVGLTARASAEPELQVAPDGAFYVVSWDELFKSMDGGATWRDVSPPLATSGDTSLAIASEGTLHMVGTGLDSDESPRIAYVRSGDGGATWTAPLELADTSHAVDRPWLVAHPDGRLALVWNDWQGKRTPVRLSLDGGLTWSEASVPGGADYRVIGRPVAWGERIVVPLNGFSHVAFYVHDAAGWRLVRGPEGRFINVQAAVDGSGLIHVVTGEHTGTGRQVFHRATRDFSGWSAPLQVSSTIEAVWPWPAGGRGEGEVAIAYYAKTQSTGLEGILPGVGDRASEWHVEVALVDTDRIERLRTGEAPVRRGGICTGGSTCPAEDWAFRDYFGTAALPDGGLGLAHDRDHSAGVEVVFTRNR